MLLFPTIFDTVESDIQCIRMMANEFFLYGMRLLTFERLTKVADPPFDLFFIPLIFAEECETNRDLPFHQAKRVEIR